jgi:hypothetical protein
MANFTVRLSSGNLNLLVQIHDLMNSVTDFNISSIISVLSKQTNNLLAELHETKDQNSIGQIINSISQEFNQITNENFNKAMKSRTGD